MTKKEMTLNKLYNIFNNVAGGRKYPLATIDSLWFVILDIKVQNRAEFVDDELFDLLKDEFNIKTHGIGYILDLKNN